MAMTLRQRKIKEAEKALYDARIEYYTLRYTAYDSFEHMCKSLPTLRPTSPDEIQPISILRNAYRSATGKEAAL